MSRSERLKAALDYAEAGWPVLPVHAIDENGICTCGGQEVNPKCSPGKHPRTGRGHLDATTNPQQITDWWNRWQQANIGVATGARSGLLVLDQDHPAALDALEDEHGRLPATRTHATGSGGLHYVFRYPSEAGQEIRNSAGKLGESLDIRGEGGYVVMPPSQTTRPYELLGDLPLAEAPAWLLEALRRKPRSGPGEAPLDRGPRAAFSASLDGATIPERRRNTILVSICGQLHDGTRSEAELTADLAAIRDARCENPGTFTDAEIGKIARWTHGKEPCRKAFRADPEVEEALEACSSQWYERRLPKGGRSKLRDVYRACLMSAARRREIRELKVDGKIVRGPAFSDSTRQLAEVANTSNVSVWTNLGRLVELGALARAEDPSGTGMAPTYILTTAGTTAAEGEAAQRVNTPHQPPVGPAGRRVAGGVNLPRAHDLTTPMYGWGSPVGNSGGGVEAAVEAFGPQTTEELAERLGVSRPRDLERRQLARLEAMGVIARDGDGRWVLPKDHAGSVERRVKTPYTTVRRRRRRKTTNEGRVVVWVEETEMFASEEERAAMRAAYYAKERAAFRKIRQARLARLAAECFGLASRPFVDPETGEIPSERREVPTGGPERVEDVREGVAAYAEASEPVEPAVASEPGERVRAQPGEQPGEPISGLAVVVGRYLDLHPGRSKEPPSWLATALWSEDLVGGKPTADEVREALGELGRAA